MPIKRKRAYVYILRCADDTLYIGTAKELEKRLATHNSAKGAKYTRARLPVTLTYQEGPMSLTKALRREHQLKQLTRTQKQAVIAGELLVPHRRKR
ncbi:GIY-YIG nuclease family protein [Oleiharenicola lentus]|uniref:GIY-YIG nuclease family protein n=1 Tax=Oleiharenicola lentus TaxID=2508720 RepID=UPI003F6744E5